MIDAELENFKTGIDLRAYAASQGYALDAKESWRGSAVMRHSASDDKIIIKRDADGHYIYCSVRDDADNGSIVDFVQHRTGCSLGVVRKELRPWIGMPAERLPVFPALPRTTKDRAKVERDYLRTDVVIEHRYLEDERALPAGLLRHDRFAGRIRTDAHRNAIFPHFDKEGLCGYEMKNSGSFTGFSAGGTKGLWFSRTQADDQRLVFCESAIDALSYAALFQDARTRYASIGGKPNPIQPELIKAAIMRMAAGSEIVSAMDADPDGAKLAGVVKDAFEQTGRDDLKFVLQEPFGAKDWNDQLRNQRHALIANAQSPEAPRVS